MPRETGYRGVDLIKGFETLELEAYPDPASALGKACTRRQLPMRRYRNVVAWETYPGAPWTIGWGHTGPEIRPGDTITAERADALFQQDLEIYEAGVNRLVKVPLNQNQFDALVSFAYNVGLDIDTDQTAEGLGDSTLLKYLNLHKYELASGEFLKWNKAGGVVLLGLARRRVKERALFIEPFVETAP